MLATGIFGIRRVFWSVLRLLIIVFGDIFPSNDLGGWVNAIGTIFVIVLPYLGVFVYVIARGHKMGPHAVAGA